MQKNKKLMYILIPGTLLLWGIIIYKIVGVVNGKADSNAFVKKAIVTGTEYETGKDTFTISADYRDPFLGKLPAPPVEQAMPQKEAPAPKTILTVPWPAITYSGIIKNQESNKQLVLIQVNEQSNTMKVGDVVSGVELTKVFRDSIEVKFNKEKKYIKK